MPVCFDSAHELIRNAVLNGNVFLLHAPDGSYFCDDSGRQNCSSILLAALIGCSFLVLPVFYVVSIRSQKKMIRVYARRVVASMENAEANGDVSVV